MEASLVLKGYIKDCVSRFRLEFLFKIVWIKKKNKHKLEIFVKHIGPLVKKKKIL